MSQYWRCAGWKDWLWILWKANAKLPCVMPKAFAWEYPFYAGRLLLKWQTNAWQEKTLISLFLLLHLYCTLSLIICHLVRSPREPDSPLPHTSCNHLHQCKVSAKLSHTSAHREVQLQRHSSRQDNGGWVWKASEGACAHHSCLHKTSSIGSPLAWRHWPSKRTDRLLTTPQQCPKASWISPPTAQGAADTLQRDCHWQWHVGHAPCSWCFVGWQGFLCVAAPRSCWRVPDPPPCPGFLPAEQDTPHELDF